MGLVWPNNTAALRYVETKKTQISSYRGEERSFSLPSLPLCDGKEKTAYTCFGNEVILSETSVLAFSTCCPQWAVSAAFLIAQGCFVRRNFISSTLLTFFWDADSGSYAMLQCQAVNSWQGTASDAFPGREGACVPVQAPLVSGRGWEAAAWF